MRGTHSFRVPRTLVFLFRKDRVLQETSMNTTFIWAATKVGSVESANGRGGRVERFRRKKIDFCAFLFHVSSRMSVWCWLHHAVLWGQISSRARRDCMSFSVKPIIVSASIFPGSAQSFSQNVSSWSGSQTWKPVRWGGPHQKYWDAQYGQEEWWVWHFSDH